MVERLYARLQRKGHLLRDCQRLVNNDRNVFGALMLDMGMGDAMITGVTRHFRQTMVQVKLVIDPAGGHVPFGIHMMVGQKHTVFIADTTVNERPTASELADIAEQTATVARAMGQEPRVAFLSYANFGNPRSEEHTSELQSLMRISYAVFCLTKQTSISAWTVARSSTYTTT